MADIQFTDKHEKMLQETHDTVIVLKTVLLGEPGVKGLAKTVEYACEENVEIKEDLNKTKKMLYGLISLLAGSGILGGSTLAVIEIMKNLSA